MSSPTWFLWRASYDGKFFWIGGGDSFLRTRKVRNIVAGRRRVALVFDDLPSFDPFIARSVRVYGVADDPVERVGLSGPGWYVRIVPTESWSWNLGGEPVGERVVSGPPSGARQVAASPHPSAGYRHGHHRSGVAMTHRGVDSAFGSAT